MEEFRGYKIKPIERLGEGAFGYVEKVELYNLDGGLCGIYARKVLAPQGNILSSISIEEIKRRFIREVTYQSYCSHANIIYIYLFNRYAENPYFVMELGECDLEEEINAGQLTYIDKVRIVLMVLNAAKKIHDKGYLHRDIKPKNILKFGTGLYKLTDFGLVKDIDGERNTTALTAIGCMMGTRKYMAPEIMIDAEYSAQTDIYALGIVFREMKIDNALLSVIIEKCVKRDKVDRYETIDEILRDIDRAGIAIMPEMEVIL